MSETMMLIVNDNKTDDDLNKRPKVDQEESRFFIPGVVNVFTNSSKTDSFSKATVSNCITITGSDGNRAMFPSETRHVRVDTYTDGEIVGVVYALRKFNTTGIPTREVNIFTDSLHAMNRLKFYMYSMNGIYQDKFSANQFIGDAVADPKMDENILSLIRERLKIQAPVNLYYVKSRTVDITLARSKFYEINKKNVSVSDIMNLIAINSYVDMQISLYSRCIGCYED
jgi:hypothetical protein